jgi:hypothetical protein
MDNNDRNRRTVNCDANGQVLKVKATIQNVKKIDHNATSKVVTVK